MTKVKLPVSYLGKKWLNYVYFYALDSATIRIACAEITEWKEYACFTDTTPLKKQDEIIALHIPPKFVTFYGIERKHKVVTLNVNTLLVTITVNLIEEKKYPT